MTNDEIDKAFASWIGEDVDSMEKDEVFERLKDMFEAESRPIRECKECTAKGKVCYENDDGLSHRLSQGELQMDELRRMKRPFLKALNSLDRELLDM